ncbi:U3 small nucleolar RNA-associated protein [Histoplasma capsulatum G186AR]|uniref:U3 small nucleolar RNA-associated protein n=2 Tax=Ajellomyces capsulatus TaxID=5037 RepID=C0NZI1_AJECG|nr:U3 small nucleolar RNA-associated protein [Histoplasma capsulatum G186AR]EEH03229.1 U3 small nucleolar RNA-associated protein [Histoplasma capsulatum G186AR]KAG5290370.1 U3 small nucleolar RNA-associated protein [Histoplasma capsulatum]QSS72297.1 U3 small nucleolar RNA-associated protein [Histoplasma capsulatum G186AR]
MAAPVLPLPQTKLPSIPSTRLTPEQQYWRSFKNPLLLPSPSNSPINHISQPSLPSSASSFSTSAASSPAAPPDLFTVTTGARVQLYSIRTRKLLKTITRFDDIARCASVRADGRVLAASDDGGTIQVFDIHSRAILKTWREHKQPVWAVQFSPANPTALVSASDDRTVRLWDLPSETSVRTFVGHADYVRCAGFMPAAGGGRGGDLLYSGGYDGLVKVWDSRAATAVAPGRGGRSVMTFKMRAPVESVLPLAAGTTVLAAAENKIAVLDVVAGKPLHVIKSHQKTVTALSLASGGRRVVSGALDGHMKVFETTGWNVVGGSKYPSPILSLGVITTGSDREDKHIAVGMQSGLLSIRTRLSGEQKVRERERQREMQALLDGKLDEHDKRMAKKQKQKRGKGWEKRLRGMDFVGEGVDIVIDAQEPSASARKRKREQPWELDLRKGRYAAALDAVLCPPNTNDATPTNSKLSTLTLLTALRHRSALRTALSGRDEVTLQPVLQWVYKSITDPRVVDMCVEVAMNILDIYSGNLGQSVVFDGMVEKLHARVREEVDRAQQAWMTKGMLGMLSVS